MARELFNNVEDLYEQIETQYNDRSGEEGMGGQMAVRKTLQPCSSVEMLISSD